MQFISIFDPTLLAVDPTAVPNRLAEGFLVAPNLLFGLVDLAVLAAPSLLVGLVDLFGPLVAPSLLDHPADLVDLVVLAVPSLLDRPADLVVPSFVLLADLAHL